MKQISLFVLLAVVALTARAGGDSSDGHTHGEVEPVATAISGAPRALASSEAFELVAVLEGKKLLLYLDRFASNEPVAGARVEADGGGLNGVAAETVPGIYVMDAASMPKAKIPLTISIEAGEDADLLSATLDISSAEASAESEPRWRDWLLRLLVAAFLLAGIGWAIVRRKQSGGMK